MRLVRECTRHVRFNRAAAGGWRQMPRQNPENGVRGGHAANFMTVPAAKVHKNRPVRPGRIFIKFKQLARGYDSTMINGSPDSRPIMTKCVSPRTEKKSQRPGFDCPGVTAGSARRMGSEFRPLFLDSAN
jgi:hypothetical protein